MFPLTPTERFECILTKIRRRFKVSVFFLDMRWAECSTTHYISRSPIRLTMSAGTWKSRNHTRLKQGGCVVATEGTSYDFPDVIASLYGLWTLDGLVELAYAVSLDFVSRPESYVGVDIPDAISDFRVSWGTHKEFQNTAERQAMVSPILGRSDWLRGHPRLSSKFSLNAVSSALPCHVG
jgi:hypothetical protein